MSKKIDSDNSVNSFINNLYGFVSEGMNMGDDAALRIVNMIEFWYENGSFACWLLGHKYTQEPHSCCVRCGRPGAFAEEKPGLFLFTRFAPRCTTAPAGSPVPVRADRWFVGEDKISFCTFCGRWVTDEKGEVIYPNAPVMLELSLEDGSTCSAVCLACEDCINDPSPIEQTNIHWYSPGGPFGMPCV